MLSGWILSLKVQQILPVAMLFRFIWVLATGLQGGYCHYYSTDARGCRNTASSISRQAGQETPEQRLADLQKYLQRSRS